MSNVLKFPTPQEDSKGFNEFIDVLKDSTDQLIFIQVNKEGNIALGHSPLGTKELIVMFYHLQRYIQSLLDDPEENGYD